MKAFFRQIWVFLRQTFCFVFLRVIKQKTAKLWSLCYNLPLEGYAVPRGSDVTQIHLSNPFNEPHPPREDEGGFESLNCFTFLCTIYSTKFLYYFHREPIGVIRKGVEKLVSMLRNWFFQQKIKGKKTRAEERTKTSTAQNCKIRGCVLEILKNDVLKTEADFGNN